ncbi:MAG: hypothetical protein HW416_2938, partial [Chloroflexi bacterium]|nr:hypothetical protein [Chloroflexota bacterium]
MGSCTRVALTTLTIVVLMAGCADRPAPSVTQPGSAEPARLKRIVGAVVSDPPFLSYKIVSAAQGGYPGAEALESLVHTGLSTFDREGRLRPVLAEDLPSTDNGQWQVFPDGRMETTWKIRPNAQWHDGIAFTASDLLFTKRVVDDPDLPFFERQPATLIERIVAPDPRTVTLTWKRPFIQADALFSRFMAMPLPSHILERAFDADPATLANLPYFTQEFVGSGPFKLRDWVPGSHIIVQANDAYVLGRPRVDEVEIRFIPDQNTLGANILSGTVEFTIGRGVELETAMQIRDQWADGRMETAPVNWNQMFPQFLNPNPAVVGEVRFRRALLHALNRQEIVDTLQFGLSSIAHSYVHPTEPEFKEIESNIVKYEYDPRRAAQIIDELGYTRGPDGVFVDGSNRKLTVQLRSSAANQGKMLLTVADYWQATGV